MVSTTLYFSVHTYMVSISMVADLTIYLYHWLYKVVAVFIFYYINPLFLNTNFTLAIILVYSISWKIVRTKFIHPI